MKPSESLPDLAKILPRFEGWQLIGAYSEGEIGDVGSWLLSHEGEAVLLEVPEGLKGRDVKNAVKRAAVKLRYVVASHDHYDHLATEEWEALQKAFPDAEFIHPSTVRGDRSLSIGDEPLWLIKAPKHSKTDIVTVFRGVAMTGDIELGMLESVNDEVPARTKKQSMNRLRDFQDRTGYRVHSIVSAHLNDVRCDICWPELFRFE